MLRCTIELIPFGKELEKRALSEILISNDGTGNTDIGNYRATVCENNQYLLDVSKITQDWSMAPLFAWQEP